MIDYVGICERKAHQLGKDEVLKQVGARNGWFLRLGLQNFCGLDFDSPVRDVFHAGQAFVINILGPERSVELLRDGVHRGICQGQAMRLRNF